MKHLILFNLLFVLLTVVCQAQQIKVIHSVAELPKHSYKLPAEKAEDIITNSVYLGQLMDSIKHNIFSDLKEYSLLISLPLIS